MSRIASIALSFIAVFAIVANTGCTRKKEAASNTLNIPVIANIKGLDPVTASDLYSSTVASHIYDTLLEYDYLQRPFKLNPLLSEGMPTASKDGLTHTFKIRKDAKFQDDAAFTDGKGRLLTAQDFIYSWKRLADARNASEGFWIFDGKIKGLNEWKEKLDKDPTQANFDAPIEGLTATDANTLVIKLTKPYFQLYYVLAMTFTAPVAKEAVDKYGKEYLNHPVGTGPYILKDWIRNNKITLVKNPNWHGQTYPTEGAPGDQEKGLLADAGKALPLNDTLVFHEIIEDQPRWLNTMKGELDVISIPKDNFDSSVEKGVLKKEFADKGFQLSITPELDVTYTAFNMESPLFKNNANLRKAMAYASDTKVLIEKFYNGRAIDAQSPIPPNIDGFDPNFKNPYKTTDLAKAKEFMIKAGYPDGKGLPELEYDTTNSATSRQMAEFFQQEMEKIGIKVKIITNTWPQFTDKIRDRKAQVWGIAWGADYPDAENFLQLLFGGNVSPGPNGSNYKNPKFDELYKKAALLPPGTARTNIYKQMRDMFVEDMPWIPQTHRLAYVIHHGWVKNYKRHEIANNFFKYVRVDGAQRAEKKGSL